MSRCQKKKRPRQHEQQLQWQHVRREQTKSHRWKEECAESKDDTRPMRRRRRRRMLSDKTERMEGIKRKRTNRVTET